MRKLITVSILLLCGIAAQAQYVTITGTNANYANGTLTAKFVSQGGHSPGLAENTVPINSSGSFTLTAWNNNWYGFVPSLTVFKICVANPVSCWSTVPQLITAGEDISTLLAAAPVPSSGSSTSLPAATAAGQSPVSTGAGTNYTAQSIVAQAGTPTNGQIAVWAGPGLMTAATPTGTGSPVQGIGPTIQSPVLTGTPTAPTQGCASNTDIATGAYVASCGAANLPSAPSIGAVPTATGGGTTYTGQIPLGGTTWYYPVEWYGAVGDATGAAGVGTDNSTAFQNAINAIQASGHCGQIFLQAKKYRVTTTPVISQSCVGVAGVSYGAFSIAISNQLSASLPVSAIVIDSVSADAVDAAGASLGAPISLNRFDHFTMIRTVADNGTGTGCKNGANTAIGAAGLSIQYAGGFVIDHVFSEDSACGFYFQNAGAFGVGSVENSAALWGYNGFNPTSAVQGFVLNGANSAESFRLRHSFAATIYPGYSGVQSIGFLAAGPQLNDIFLDNFETYGVTYGKFFLYQGSGASYSAGDIHMLECVDDTFFQDGTVIDGLTSANGASIEINGGWEAAAAGSNTAGVYILNSNGVMVSNVEFGQSGTPTFGVESSGSSHISVTGNHFVNTGTASVYLSTTSDASVTGNIFEATSGNTQTMIDGLSLTRSVFSGNTLGGYASVGVALDSGSSNNTYTGVAAIDPAHITTQVSNLGLNNTFDGVGGLIAKVVVSGSPTSVTLSPIPQNYTNPHLMGNFTTASTNNLALQFNGDTTAGHYGYGFIYQFSGTVEPAVQSNSAPYMLVGAQAGVLATDIPAYTTGPSSGVGVTGTFSLIGLGSFTETGTTSGLWSGTDVTSIKLFTGASDVISNGSVFSLYGLN